MSFRSNFGRTNFPKVGFATSAWFFIALILASCGNDKNRIVAPAFYHWKTTLALSSSEREYLDSFSCKKLYVKILDIGRDPATGEIQPYSLLKITDTAGLSRFEIVPTIFITNEVFKNISEEKIEWLAGKVADSMSEKWTKNELQFDCDWTASTRDAFFSFLKKVKKHLPKETRLSATIRLHQYKFPEKTGVPPVERGMLMFYNTGDIENPEAGNSIFSIADIEKYLVGAPKNYPLPLDLALPVFSWALVYRDGELWKIIPEMPENELADTVRFKNKNIHHSSPMFRGRLFIIQKGTFLAGHYLRPDDLLRLEAISPDLLCEAAGLAAQADLANDATVAFFHLDTAIVRRYPVQLLDSVCRMIQFPEKKK
ncbi:MAG: hypothetical protein OHK0019_19940 [Saprospiraceae bacterium]